MIAETLDPSFSIPDVKKCIVIGAGPSLERYDQLKTLAKSKYKGKLIVTDLILKKVLDAGITPDKFPLFYVVSSEDGGDVQPLFHHDIIGKWADKIRIILFTVHKDVESYIKGLKMTTQIKNDTFETSLLANVGGMCWYAAWKYLNCNEIAMIGMNHSYPVDHLKKFSVRYQTLFFKSGHNDVFDNDYVLDPVYQYFSSTFNELLTKMPKEIKTINCSEEGAIFQHCENMRFKDYVK